MERILDPEHRTRLLPLCRWAGWLTGALPALITAPAVYRTIEAVETFVDGHYLEQIVALNQDSKYHELKSLLEQCREDEISHRNDARARLAGHGLIGKLWSGLIAQGSSLGVNLAKWI
jgi:ubiquinone biosynthesis monooxygenase Coq7